MSISVTELVSSITLKDSISFTLNMEALNSNFYVVKQCLLKIQEIESTMGRSKESNSSLEQRVRQLEQANTENSLLIKENSSKIQQLSNNVGDDFMKKMYAIEEKTKNIHDFDETVRRIQKLNKFVSVDTFNNTQKEMNAELERVQKLKDQLNRYVQQVNFTKYQEEQEHSLAKKQDEIDSIKEIMKQMQAKIDQLQGRTQKVSVEIEQNNNMIKEIDFAGMLHKITMLKEQTEKKVDDMSIKLKKKVGHAEIMAFEKSMIEKLDRFFTQNERSKAEKAQTKDALLFLQKKIIQIQALLLDKFGEEETDALFSTKRWQCASCAKDLGKYQGKLGQYLPWSIFPCKQMNPEQSGGFGYLNYIDKVNFKRGSEAQQPQMQRLNKTFYDSKDKTASPLKRMSQTRASNLISNYGSQERGSSLKDAYFSTTLLDKGEKSGAKTFRVSKKEPAKMTAEGQKDK